MDQGLRSALAAGPLSEMSSVEREIFFDRVELHYEDLVRPLGLLYGERRDLGALVPGYLQTAAEHYAARSEELRLMDLRRLAQPDWFQESDMVGYACYADRFAGDLKGVVDRIPYLQELGVTYLHLMPLLAARQGENDGGYAVVDYTSVDPRLGTMSDLNTVASELRRAGISLCIDVVGNHTADTHAWAQRALAGDEDHQAYYYMYPDRDIPDRYEATLREIFPDSSPGSFTWQPEIDRWVWTTFRDYQWDLNYSNPTVLGEMASVILGLANHGADVLRLDAVAFMWKQLGTTSENLPEAHAILQVWRALSRIVAPGVLLLAEAIVPVDETVPYFGVGAATGKECELAYHHFFMVLLWSSLAEQKVSLMTRAMSRAPSIPSGGAWLTYVRSHDDIGWAITPSDAATAGLDDFAHRDFLSDVYTGQFPGSFARGEVCQENPKTSDRRVTGTTASLAGLQQAVESGDDVARELAFARIRLVYAMVDAQGGIPIIWSGDEIGTLNDYSYVDVPEHADDTRWIHRPAVASPAVDDRHKPETIAGRVHSDLAAVFGARKRTHQFHAAARTEVMWSGNEAVLALLRTSSRGDVLVLGNFSPTSQLVPAGRLAELGFGGDLVDLLAGQSVSPVDHVALEPYETVWLTASTPTRR